MCRGGRVRKKYVVTPRGVADVFRGFPEYVEISNRYVRDLAEKQKSSFPLIFNLWPEFVQEKAEDLACRKLIDAMRMAVLSNIEMTFFSLIVKKKPRVRRASFGSLRLFAHSISAQTQGQKEENPRDRS